MKTGISATGENYKSKKGAIKHARENLEAVLLEHGIIDSDDVQGDIPTGIGAFMNQHFMRSSIIMGSSHT